MKKLLVTGLAYAAAVITVALVSSPAMAAGWTSSPRASEVAGVPVYTVAP